MSIVFLIIAALKVLKAEIATGEIQFLNELPLDKLLRLKNSLQDIVTTEYENITSTTPTFLEAFGAQALKGPIRKSDYEEEDGWKKHGYHDDSKISNIFSMSVTTLAFLAFGGYLLCLIVQAMRAKQMNNFIPPTTVQPATFFVSAGIKKRPQLQPQFASYGRKKRDDREARTLREIDLPPEQLFTALLQLCEGYAKWSEH